MDSYLESPVFICGHRKGGTTMLINLFDNVRGVIAYPDDSGFFYRYYPRYASDEYTDSEKIRRLSQVMIEEKLGEIINSIECSENEKKILHQKKEEFSWYIKKYDKKDFDYSEILLYFIESFKRVFYKDHDANVWVEKTTTSEIYALELSRVFPKAKFIHIVRDPRDNWASLLSGWDKKYSNFNDSPDRLLQSLIERGRLGMEFARSNVQTIGEDRYKIIKYEDLTKDPKVCLRRLAEFINIPFDSNLMYPTRFGYTWRGNNFDGLKTDKPTNVNVSRWKERISEHDAKIIEFHFSDMMNYFGYERAYSEGEAQLAAAAHYKWFNFSTEFSDK